MEGGERSRGIEGLVPYLLVFPALGYLLFFIGVPLAEALYMSLTSGGSFSLSNFDYLLHSPFSEFVPALKNTFLLAVIVIPIQAAIAIGLAMLLNTRFWGRNAALYIVILPLTISDVAAGLIWYSMLSYNGFLNKFLVNAGIINHPITWFGYQYRWREFLAIVIAEVWRATAIVFVIIFAGLQLVNREVLEAAEVFGANVWQRIRYIVLPLLMPSLQAALIIRTLFALQVFGDVWILAGRDVPVLAGEAYYEEVTLRHFGVASLYALIIAAISVVIGYGYMRFLKPKYLELG